MLLIHTIECALRSGRHACMPGVRGWQSSAPFPMAAATAADLIQCGPALTEEAI